MLWALVKYKFGGAQLHMFGVTIVGSLSSWVEN